MEDMEDGSEGGVDEGGFDGKMEFSPERKVGTRNLLTQLPESNQCYKVMVAVS